MGLIRYINTSVHQHYGVDFIGASSPSLGALSDIAPSELCADH